MAIFLKPITKENYDAICDIDVAKHQQDLVACNMYSLVESFFNEILVIEDGEPTNESVGANKKGV